VLVAEMGGPAIASEDLSGVAAQLPRSAGLDYTREAHVVGAVVRLRPERFGLLPVRQTEVFVRETLFDFR
jgi:hypothetical protein